MLLSFPVCQHWFRYCLCVIRQQAISWSNDDSVHFSDNIFKCIFLNEKLWISVIVSQKFVPKGLISNMPALVQMMAWRRPVNKPLSEPMMVNILIYICVTRPKWVKSWFYRVAVALHTVETSKQPCCPTPPSHYLNQCWQIVMFTFGNKLQWNWKKNITIFVLCKRATHQRNTPSFTLMSVSYGESLVSTVGKNEKQKWPWNIELIVVSTLPKKKEIPYRGREPSGHLSFSKKQVS